MERRPCASRPRIPGGYGNYPGRDPDSPPPERRGRRKRPQGPWGGLSEGQAQTPLPRAPWEAGDRGDGAWYEAVETQQRQPAAAVAAGGGRGAAGVGGVGGIAEQYGTAGTSNAGAPTWAAPPGSALAGGYAGVGPPSRGASGRRKSPLLADAPRLTVLPPLVRPGDVSPNKAEDNAPGEGDGFDGESAAGGQSRKGKGGRQGERASLRQSASASAASSSSWRRARTSTRAIGTIAAGNVGGSPDRSVASSNRHNTRSRRDRMTMPSTTIASGRWDGDGALRGRVRGGSTINSRQSSRKRNGFGAAGTPSPFLLARSAGGMVHGWRSPLEQSAVNPFSASFGVGSYAEQQQGVDGAVGWLGSGRGSRGGAADSAHPLLRGSGGGGGGYGSRWDGGGTSGENSKGGSVLKRLKSTGHKVDDQGHQIFYKHGVRLVEAAEIRMDTLAGPTAYCVFLLPYLLLALALWLDLGKLDAISHPFPPSANACDSDGVCHWKITCAPIYNSYLNVKADFELVDGIIPGLSPVSVGPDRVTTGNVGDSVMGGDGGSGNGVIGRGGIEGEGSTRARTLSSAESLENRWESSAAVAGSVSMDLGDAETAEEFDNANLRGLSLRTEAVGTEEEAWWTGERSRRMLGLGRRNRRDDYDRVHIFVGVALEVRGSTGLGEDGQEGLWETLYECDARDNVQVVTCYSTDRFCETAILGRVLFDSPGVLGRYPDYAVSATVKVIRDGKPLAGAGGLLAQSATFSVLTENPAYLRALAVTRLPLLAITAFSLLYWMTRGCGGAGGERDPAPSAIVPERRYITLLLAGLLLWQNPILAADEWMGGLCSDDRLRWVRFARDLCQYVGMQVVWLCWVCLMDCQHFVRTRQIAEPAFEGDWDAYKQVYGEDDSEATADEDDPTAYPGFLKDDFPPHHPRSESFPDFIVPKFLYGLAALGVGTCLAILRHPAIANLDENDVWADRLELAYSVLSAASGLLAFGWTLYFAKVAVSSGRVLRGQPFMATRRQQLMYRIMVMQGFIVATLLGSGVGVHFSNIVRHLIRQETIDGAASGFTWDYLTSEAAGLSTWAGGIREPLGKLILISAVCYTLAYLFLPPAHSVKRRFDRMYINMERDMPPREVVRRYKDSKELQPLFCLETSCFLVEVAWQSYYDPHRLNLSDFVAPGRQDLAYLGLSLVAYVEDEETETRAILCRGRDRLVLAFRGTARLNNIVTDLKFHQVPLPQLLPAGRDPIVIRRPDGSSGSSRFSLNHNTSGSSEVDVPGGFLRRSPSRSRSDPSPTNSNSRASWPTFEAALGGPTSLPVSSHLSISTAAPGAMDKEEGGTQLDAGERGVGDAKKASLPSDTGIGEYVSLRVGRGNGDQAEGGGDTTPMKSYSGSATVASPKPNGTEGDAKDGGAGFLGAALSSRLSSESASMSASIAAKHSILFPSGYGRLSSSTSPEKASAGDDNPAPPMNLRASAGGVGTENVDRSNNLNGLTIEGKIDNDTTANNSNNTMNSASPTKTSGRFGGAAGLTPGLSVASTGGAGVRQATDSPACDADSVQAFVDDVSDGMDEGDFEAGRIREGDFYIDPRGDGSFSTAAARCFKAVIHRIPVARQALPRVHSGFWEVYSKLREKVLAALAAEMQDEYQPLYITGHSMGGALATLAAYDINKNFDLPDTTTLYTFGSPYVGNGVFSRKMRKKVKHHFRVVNDGDMVTAMPQFFGTYNHAGVKVVVDSEKYGNFIVAPTLVEETFGAKSLTSVAPHFLGQYRECLEACMDEADLEDYVSRGFGMASGRDSKIDPDRVPDWLKGKRRKDKQEEPVL